MKLNMAQQGGLSDDFPGGGGNVTGPLTLLHTPEVPLEAATKQYVDDSFSGLNANNIISGTLATGRLPGMNGDLTSSAGSGVLTLSNTGVTPGGYAKVTVDNKGRISNGMSLINSDIPELDFSKITTDKPTTLAGYGITDAIGNTGGTLVNHLSIGNTVTTSNQLVNKAYITTASSGVGGITVGDIIANIDVTTPIGFLRCNGAELSKTTYAELYSVVGDKYSTDSLAGSGKPWQHQYQINDSANNNISVWESIGSTPVTLRGSATIVTKNSVYLLGGYNGSSYTPNVYRADINIDGTLGAWVASTALPGNLGWSIAIVIKNRVYLFGGYNGSAAITTVYTAPINSDGTLGTWGTSTALPSDMYEGHGIVTKNRVYVFGGFNTASVQSSSVYSASINSDGTLGAWDTNISLPSSLAYSQPIVTKNRIYLLGGSVANAYSSTVYTATIDNDGYIGPWSVTTSLPSSLGISHAVTFKNRVYLFGGYNGSTYVNTVFTAPINSDGTLGSWVPGTSLPGALGNSQCIITKNRIHLMGGWNGSSTVSTIYTTLITGGLNDYSSYYAIDNSVNYMEVGSGQPWKQQYQINETQTGDITGWITDSSILPAALSHSQVIVTKNRIYLLGGYTGSSAVSTVYTTTINSDGTLGAWVTGISLPVAVSHSQVIVTKNRVHLLGGWNTGSISTVYSNIINTDGTLGSWVAGTSLPGALDNSQVIVTKNRVYLLGGYVGSSAVSTVYTAPINSDGTLGTWTTGTSLPTTLSHSQVVITKNRVYLCGGYSGGSYTSNVYTAFINSDGTLSSWATSAALPAALSSSQAVVSKNRVYLLGGYNGNGYTSNVYNALINGDGTLGTWTTGTSLPIVVGYSQSIVTNNHVYLLGGRNTGPILAIYSAPLLEGLNDYSAYYADTSVNEMIAGSGQPWRQQYQINDTQSTDITGWTTETSLPSILYASQVVVTKNRVHLIGGWNSTAYISTVYTAPIDTDGVIGTWTTGTSLPVGLGWSQAMVTKNRVYVMGGHNGSAIINTVYTASINSDGTLGTWSADVNSLPGILHISQVVVTKNRVYLLGGHNGTSIISSVYTASINVDGTLGVWSTGTSLPAALNDSHAVITKNRVYLIGGTSTGGPVSTVYTASINSDGTLGTWITDTSFPVAMGSFHHIVTKNKVYLLGGSIGSVVSATTYSAPINSDGTLGVWSTGTSLPVALFRGQSVVTKNHVYLLGGHNGTAFVSTVYSATILEGLNDYSNYYLPDDNNYLMPGSGKPWNLQYQINQTQSTDITGWTAGTSLPGIMGYSQAVVTKNRVYLLGGFNGSVFLSTVYTAPINSDGTLGTWSTGTSLPTNLGYSEVIVTKNRVYLLSGFNGSTWISTVYTASINSDGTLGAWSTSVSLPTPLGQSQAIITKNRVYLMGGNNGSVAASTVYTAPINSDGTLGTWVTGTSLPGVLVLSQAVVTKNRVYLLGGSNGSVYVNTVYTAPINSDGTLGAWVTGTSLPGISGLSQVIVTKNRVYLLGGTNGSVAASTVYTAPINSDGTLGAWVTGTSLPVITMTSEFIITNNRIYLLGGFNSGGALSTTYSAPILEGLNDYSPYYDGTINPFGYVPPIIAVSSTFKIPDHSLSDTSLNFFIKF